MQVTPSVPHTGSISLSGINPSNTYAPAANIKEENYSFAPTSDNLTVQLTLNQDVDMNVSILNVTGQVMLSEQHNLNSGENRVNVLMNDLPAGIYMLRLQSKEGVITQKIVKQ